MGLLLGEPAMVEVCLAKQQGDSPFPRRKALAAQEPLERPVEPRCLSLMVWTLWTMHNVGWKSQWLNITSYIRYDVMKCCPHLVWCPLSVSQASPPRRGPLCSSLFLPCHFYFAHVWQAGDFVGPVLLPAQQPACKGNKLSTTKILGPKKKVKMHPVYHKYAYFL